MCQFRKKLVKFLLTFIELATPRVVDSKECHDTVNDKESVFISHKELCDLVQKLHLMFGVDSTSVCNIVLSYWP